MFNILKFQHSENSKVYFISDLHYAHEKLLESRGFSTIGEHNKTIIDNWNNKVNNDSTVFFLGDLVLGAGQKSQETYENLLNKLNFKYLYVMQGNHFGGGKPMWNSAFSSGKIDEYYRLKYCLNSNPDEDKVVYFIPNYYEIFVNSTPLILSHYPILSWNGIRANSILLFGHCHNSLEKTPWVKENYLKSKCMDVGFEAIKAPISFSEVKEIMDKRPIIQVDHHSLEN